MTELITIACRNCYGTGKLYTRICPECKGSKKITIQRRKDGGDTAGGE